MSTRAVYTFIDKDRPTYHVYKHHDGYARGAAEALAKAIPFAWKLPRFEADDFAAAFVAGNKTKGGGDVYLTSSYKNHMDLSYRYEIRFENKELKVTAYDDCHQNKNGRKIFEGTLKQFCTENDVLLALPVEEEHEKISHD